jgi:hypothetical protein
MLPRTLLLVCVLGLRAGSLTAQQPPSLLVVGLPAGGTQLESAAKKVESKIMSRLATSAKFKLFDSSFSAQLSQRASFVGAGYTKLLTVLNTLSVGSVLAVELDNDGTIVEKSRIDARLYDVHSGALVSAKSCTYFSAVDMGLSACIDEIAATVITAHGKLSQLQAEVLREANARKAEEAKRTAEENRLAEQRTAEEGRRVAEESRLASEKAVAEAAKARAQTAVASAVKAKADADRSQNELIMAQQARAENLRREGIAAETARQMARVQTRLSVVTGDAKAELEFWGRMSRDLVKQGRNLRSEIRRLIASINTAMDELNRACAASDYDAAFKLMDSIDKDLKELNSFR